MKNASASLMAQIACADAVESNFVSLTKGEAKRILELLKEQPKWIPVTERLPDEKINPVTMDFQQVLCFCDFGEWTDIRVYGYGKGHFWHGGGIVDYVTYWMPFPESPET